MKCLTQHEGIWGEFSNLLRQAVEVIVLLGKEDAETLPAAQSLRSVQ
jgi:hypothetical protein